MLTVTQARLRNDEDLVRIFRDKLFWLNIEKINNLCSPLGTALIDSQYRGPVCDTVRTRVEYRHDQ